ncbi:MAG: hypothetical protein HQ522_04390, partial [Bacteroidetes bacterium]|nr:hypothetical protein [Bacteroidota bacterium]
MRNSNKFLKAVFTYFLLGGLFSLSLLAQKPNFDFKTINQPDGLANSTIQGIFEDSFGFIWLASHHGVQRYDGKTFKNFEHKGNDSTGLSQNYVNDFCEDEERNIWITTGAGLNKYSRTSDRIEKYIWPESFIAKYGEPFLNKIIMDNQEGGVLWITALNVGLIRLDIDNHQYGIYSINSENDISMTWILPYPDQPDKLLLGGTSLFIFDKKEGVFDEILKLEQSPDISNNYINDAVIDPTNKNIIWLATGDMWGRGKYGGLIRFDLDTHFSRLFSQETHKNEFPDNHILQVCFQDEENLWIGTRHQGAILYKLKEDRFYNYKKNEYDEGSFATEMAIRSILIDRSGTLWFGTWGEGISLLSPIAQKFSHYKHLPGEKNGLTDNYITSFTEDNNGDIWIGTRTGGVSKFDPRKKSFENYFQEAGPSGNKPPEITYLFFDSHKNLWVGTYDDALYRYSPGTGVKIHYVKGSSYKDVSQKRITTITELKPGEILVSTYGGGLNIYNYASDSFQQFINNPSDSTSIPDNQIWLPILGDDGNYYFSGNSFTALIQFNPNTKKFKEFLFLQNISTFMMPVRISDGRIFINDVSEGLRELMLTDDPSVRTVYDNEGKLIKNIESILFDSNDMLWIGTGNGLIEFDPDTKKTKRYGAEDGLQGSEFTRFAAYKASNGEMYFGGKNGFSVFHPDKIKMSNYKPLIVFTDFKLYQESVAIGQESPLKKNILLMEEIVLDHNQNDFSFSYAALDFSNPDNINYKYKLENHDEEWIDAGNKNTASYTNMGPGKYIFKVLTTNSDRIWNDKVTSIRITIKPPWWQTTLAYFIYGILFITGIIIVDRFQRKRLKEKVRAQARERELTQAKEIEKAYNELKTTQKQLVHAEKMASLGELTAGIAHEIQNPLNFVNNFSEVNTEL